MCTKGDGTGGGVALGIDGGMDSVYDLLLASSKNRSIKSFCDCTLIVSEQSILSTGCAPSEIKVSFAPSMNVDVSAL